jgi:3-hydroxy-9,10-secoandrosta-1,3,5(10)-triene-9,17-dione monooxygenase
MRLFLVPRGDYRIRENWDTFGLCATGSNDIVVENAFIPAHRSVVPKMSVVTLDDDGTGKSALHRVPWYYVFTASITNLSIGGTRGALKDFIAAMQARMSMTGKPMRDDPGIQALAARAMSETGVAEATIRGHIARMMDAINGGDAMTPQEGLLCRAQLGSILTRLTDIVDNMQTVMGGRGIRNDGPLTRTWLDLTAARQHPGNNPAIPVGALGAMLFDPAKGAGH